MRGPVKGQNPGHFFLSGAGHIRGTGGGCKRVWKMEQDQAVSCYATNCQKNKPTTTHHTQPVNYPFRVPREADCGLGGEGGTSPIMGWGRHQDSDIKAHPQFIPTLHLIWLFVHSLPNPVCGSRNILRMCPHIWARTRSRHRTIRETVSESRQGA